MRFSRLRQRQHRPNLCLQFPCIEQCTNLFEFAGADGHDEIIGPYGMAGCFCSVRRCDAGHKHAARFEYFKRTVFYLGTHGVHDGIQTGHDILEAPAAIDDLVCPEAMHVIHVARSGGCNDACSDPMRKLYQVCADIPGAAMHEHDLARADVPVLK